MRFLCSVIIADCSSSDKLSISDKSSYGASRPASYLSKSSSLRYTSYPVSRPHQHSSQSLPLLWSGLYIRNHVNQTV